jgi:hypothetical protein
MDNLFLKIKLFILELLFNINNWIKNLDLDSIKEIEFYKEEDKYFVIINNKTMDFYDTLCSYKYIFVYKKICEKLIFKTKQENLNCEYTKCLSNTVNGKYCKYLIKNILYCIDTLWYKKDNIPDIKIENTNIIFSFENNDNIGVNLSAG